MSTITLIALEPDGYSNCDGDYWQEHPADIDFVDGLSVGDEYELTVCLHAWTETYRVVKAPDTEDDDYEVKRISNQKHRYVTTDQAEAYKDACVREAQQWISVDDRLPLDDGTEVIAVHGGNETEIVWGWLIHETHADRTYTHWMPLPTPPQHDNE